MNPKNRFFRFPRSGIWGYLIKVALIAIAYVIGGKIATSIPGVKLLGSSVWPPAGISQAALILFGSRFWPGVALGAFLYDVIDLKPSLFFGVGAALGAGLQAFVAASLLRHFKFRPAFDRLIDVVKFVIFSALISTQISCTLGAMRLALSGLIPWSEYWQVRWNWFLGDAMGIIIFTPLILILSQSPAQLNTQPLSRKQAIFHQIKIWIWLFFLISVSWLVFGSKSEGNLSHYPLEYLPFPLIIWSAIQFGQRGTVLGAFIVSSIAIWGASQGGGPFITKTQNNAEAILFLQAFMGVITITSLLLAATVAERASAEDSLRQSEIKYRELVEKAGSIILKLDRQGNITFLNEFAQTFFGYNEIDLLGKSAIGTLLPEFDMAGKNLKIMLENILSNPRYYQQNENENMRKNGERVWVSWANQAFFDADNNLTELLCIGTDITDRRRAEIALQQLNEQLESRVKERTQALTEALEALQIQQEQSEKLLLNILPEPIADRLKQGSQTIADTFAEVTVLFADIVGFTELSAQSTPSEIVGLLNEIFSRFDELAEKHNLEKIKTIGDAYMVVGGLPHLRSDHAEAIVEMGLDMMDAITEIKTLDGKPLSIRIGINSGPVVAGVIGIKKFIYDLWGDTVNIASRMESQGIPGCIQLTQNTYELLGDKYVFEKRDKLKVKGKGEMTTYFLKSRIFDN
ncbi:MASE1 domain-containing protein [Ancylothrix sp. C2]|uniref:adenylate/guanylate cyclase domain-containing protein n=1 Tax=Ancylothrix sp. D3o TaxID=2953691 RepID=UPI0021BB780A|nr:adenylate/guanylate cyclase domain-containing protein [Ancylothrix sp. D3o]MCT7949982.1 MASE1 domain-containing protein [Ancylothrix sp. D3o]